ncbi:MAG: amidase [Myxococcales bacterium]|nr:amidase [Myxococcales bacterium]
MAAISLFELAKSLRENNRSTKDIVAEALDNCLRSELGGYRIVRERIAASEAEAVDKVFACGKDPGPLAGLPISVKDLYGLPGEQTFAGGPKPLPPAFEEAGPVVRRLLNQLGIVVGKTHTVQWAFGGIGMNSHFGTPKNPFSKDVHRVPGGSSSGAGISVWEGSARIALGTDTAGSVRIPAAWTGNVGVKVTKNRWSTEGIVPLSPLFDTPGVIARDIDDAVYAFSALDGPAASFIERLQAIPERTVASLRIGFAEALFDRDCSPGVMEAVEQALSRLSAAGAVVRTEPLSGAEEAWSVFHDGSTAAIELHHFLSTQLPDYFELMDPVVGDRIKAAGSTTAFAYVDRLARIRTAQLKVRQAFANADVYVMPTVANTPPLVEELGDMANYRRENLLALRNTGIVSLLGLCAVTLPCGYDDKGMPVGLQLVAPGGKDTMLLGVARAMAPVVRC